MDAFQWHLKEKLSKDPFQPGPAPVQWMDGVPRTWHLWKVNCNLARWNKICWKEVRVSYMAAHKILHGDMPHIDNGKKLEVSHLCHNGICVKPIHLVLGTRETIWKEYPVKVGDSTQNGINHFVCATRFSEVYLFLLFPACLSLYKYVASEFQAAQEVVHFWYFTSWFVLYSLNNARCFLLLCMYVVFCAFYGSHEFLDGFFKKFVL